nr:hypothetical protein BaRGS_005756 [Batillaria attramentaria]
MADQIESPPTQAAPTPHQDSTQKESAEAVPANTPTQVETVTEQLLAESGGVMLEKTTVTTEEPRVEEDGEEAELKAEDFPSFGEWRQKVLERAGERRDGEPESQTDGWRFVVELCEPVMVKMVELASLELFLPILTHSRVALKCSVFPIEDDDSEVEHSHHGEGEDEEQSEGNGESKTLFDRTKETVVNLVKKVLYKGDEVEESHDETKPPPDKPANVSTDGNGNHGNVPCDPDYMDDSKPAKPVEETPNGEKTESAAEVTVHQPQPTINTAPESSANAGPEEIPMVTKLDDGDQIEIEDGSWKRSSDQEMVTEILEPSIHLESTSVISPSLTRPTPVLEVERASVDNGVAKPEVPKDKNETEKKTEDLDLIHIPLSVNAKRETAIMRLTNRIKALELNNQEQELRIERLETRVDNLTLVVQQLADRFDTFAEQMTDRQMIATSVNFLLLLIAVTIWLRSCKPAPLHPDLQFLLDTMPRRPQLPSNLPRRNSDVTMSGSHNPDWGPAATLRKGGSAANLDDLRELGHKKKKRKKSKAFKASSMDLNSASALNGNNSQALEVQTTAGVLFGVGSEGRVSSGVIVDNVGGVIGGDSGRAERQFGHRSMQMRDNALVFRC